MKINVSILSLILALAGSFGFSVIALAESSSDKDSDNPTLSEIEPEEESFSMFKEGLKFTYITVEDARSFSSMVSSSIMEGTTINSSAIK